MSHRDTKTQSDLRNGSRLFYHGTNTEVQLGDRVHIKRWFRADLDGVVSYIPGISPRRAELEDADEQFLNWAIRLSNGVVLTMGYYPDVLQPPKKIVFVRRSMNSGIGPDEPLI